MASATTSSAPPSPYISAVSISVMPELEAEPDRRHLGRPLRPALAHAPGAEPQHRHLVTRFERHLLHLALSFDWPCRARTGNGLLAL